jgi:hypothetical protein
MSCKIKCDHVSDQLSYKHSTLILNIPSLSKPTMFNIHHTSTMAEITQELNDMLMVALSAANTPKLTPNNI